MKTIRISDQVWNEIAKLGVFGETPNDVLERVFQIDSGKKSQPNLSRNGSSKRTRRAKYRLSSKFANNNLILEFSNGVSKKFPLPDKSDKNEISNVTNDVMQFIKDNGGTIGQIHAGRKALTEAGYHIVGPVYR
jgi:hypothetical protein